MLWWRRIEPAIVQAVSTELDTEDYVVMEDDEDDSAGFDNDGGGRGKWSKSKVSEEVLVVVLLCSDEIEMKVLKVGQAEHSVCFQRTLVALQIEEAERSKRETEKAGHSKRAKKNRERHERRQSEERRTTKIRTFNESRAEAVTEGVGEKMDVDPPEARGYRQGKKDNGTLERATDGMEIDVPSQVQPTSPPLAGPSSVSHATSATVLSAPPYRKLVITMKDAKTERKTQDKDTGREHKLKKFVRCVCGVRRDDKQPLILCDGRLVWQHRECMGVKATDDEVNAPSFEFFRDLRKPERHIALLEALERGEKPREMAEG